MPPCRRLPAMLPPMRIVYPRPARAPARSGLAVVEVLVALVIVSVGVLAMAGTSSLSLRTAATATRERLAVRRVNHRLAVLAASGCARAESGVSDGAGDGMRERWTVGPPTAGVALLEASTEWRESNGPRAVVLRSAILC